MARSSSTSSKNAAEPSLPPTYEAALAELEQLVGQMESGVLPLEQLLGSYQRGATEADAASFRDIITAQIEAFRADDGPAYLTIMVVGHVLAPLIMFVYSHWRPEPWTMATMFSVGTVALSLYLLPRIKGAFVGLQWSRRMHGFGGNERG